MSKVYVQLDSFEAPGAVVTEMIFKVAGGSDHIQRLNAVEEQIDRLRAHIPPIACDAYECRVLDALWMEFRYFCFTPEPIKLTGEFSPVEDN
jgi:hypothetical protein